MLSTLSTHPTVSCPRCQFIVGDTRDQTESLKAEIAALLHEVHTLRQAVAQAENARQNAENAAFDARRVAADALAAVGAAQEHKGLPEM